jgi:hypothetical protein
MAVDFKFTSPLDVTFLQPPANPTTEIDWMLQLALVMAMCNLRGLGGYRECWFVVMPSLDVLSSVGILSSPGMPGVLS